MNIRLLDWQMEIILVHLYRHRINTKYWQERQEYPSCQLCLPTAAARLTVQSVVWSMEPGVTSVMKYDIYHRGKCGPTSRSVCGIMITLSSTQREKGKVTTTSSQEMQKRSQPRKPRPVLRPFCMELAEISFIKYRVWMSGLERGRGHREQSTFNI